MINCLYIILIILLNINSFNTKTYNSSQVYEYDIKIPINEVLSGYTNVLTQEDYNNYLNLDYDLDEHSPKAGIAFIKSDNSLWITNYANKLKYDKKADNVASVIYDSYKAYCVILKTDGSVWVCAHSNEPNTTFEKITNNAIMIDVDNYSGYIIKVLKNDNTLYYYTFDNSILKEEKIMSNVAYIKTSHISIPNEDTYTIIVGIDGTLWQENNVTLDRKKVTDNVLYGDVQGDKCIVLKRNGSLYYWNCKDVINEQNIKKVEDNIKLAKFSNNYFNSIFLIKSDNTSWLYKMESVYNYYNLNFNTKIKLPEDINNIIGDITMIITTKNNKLMKIIDVDKDNKVEEYDVDINRHTKIELGELKELEKYGIKIPSYKNVSKK